MSEINSNKFAGDLREQYGNSKNLGARAGIYRFVVNKKESWGKWIFDRMLEHIPADADVLEVGCGPGGTWKENLERVPGNWRVVLTDLMPGMIEEARARLGSDARFRFGEMDCERIDWPDGSFDAVVANHMLYHVADLPRGLGEIRRVLKPGGVLLAATNSDAHMGNMQKLINEFMGDQSPVTKELKFSLDNGGEQLREFFGDVREERLCNELRVTEAEAVVEYVLSVERGRQIIVGAKLDALRRRVEEGITADGAFVDRTEAGVWVAGD